jgi:hypothetical protein
MLSKDWKLKLWIKIAKDEKLWNWHLSKLQTTRLSIPLLTQTEQEDPPLPHHPHTPNPHHDNQIHQGTRIIKEKNTHDRETSLPLPLHPQHRKPLRKTTTRETGIQKAWDAT